MLFKNCLLFIYSIIASPVCGRICFSAIIVYRIFRLRQQLNRFIFVEDHSLEDWDSAIENMKVLARQDNPHGQYAHGHKPDDHEAHQGPSLSM